MADKYDSEWRRPFCSSERLGKQPGLEPGPQHLGGLFMENHSRKEFSAGEFWPFALSFLQCCSYSLQPANHQPPGQQPHPALILLTLNMCYWKQGSTRNFEFGPWGPNCQPILKFCGIRKDLTRVILTSLGPRTYFHIRKTGTMENTFKNRSQESSSVGSSLRGITNGKAWILQAHSVCGLLNHKCAIGARFFDPLSVLVVQRQNCFTS